MYILDLSQFLMYDFNFNDTKEKYGKIAKLLFTDTYNLVYEIEKEANILEIHSFMMMQMKK